MFFYSHTMAGLRMWGLLRLSWAVGAEKKREERQRKVLERSRENRHKKEMDGMTGNGKEKMEEIKKIRKKQTLKNTTKKTNLTIQLKKKQP